MNLAYAFIQVVKTEAREEEMKTWRKKGAFSSQYKIIQSGGDGGKDSSIKH